jgi:hypothetical protein
MKMIYFLILSVFPYSPSLPRLLTTGEHLAELLIETLQSACVNIAKMRVQGYDGAANMSGKYNGVQARILNTIQGARLAE